jgi:hypothetical protein
MTWKDRLNKRLERAEKSRSMLRFSTFADTVSQAYSPDQPNVTGGNGVAKRLADQDNDREGSESAE